MPLAATVAEHVIRREGIRALDTSPPENPYTPDQRRRALQPFITQPADDGWSSGYCPVCEEPGVSESPSAGFDLSAGTWKCHKADERHGLTLDALILRHTEFGVKGGPPAGFWPTKATEARTGAALVVPLEDQDKPDQWHDQMIARHPDGPDYLTTARGLTLATLKRFKIGHDGERYTIPVRQGFGAWVNARRYLPGGKPKMLNLPGHGTAALAFTETLAGNSLPVLVTEGEWDALLAWQLAEGGYVVTTGTGGAMTVPADLSALAGREVFVCYDDDKTGRKGAEKFVRRATEAGATAYRLEVTRLGVPARDKREDLTDAFMRYRATGADVLAEMERLRADAGAASQEWLPLTDLGNAERFVARYKADCRYLWQADTWLVWDGRRWVADTSGQVQRWMKATVRAIYHETQPEAPAWARKSEAASRIDAALKLARSEAALRASAVDFDARPDLLNVGNGTIDLRTGELREHRREDYLRQIVEVDFDPSAEAPEFVRFLATVQPDPEMRAFLQRAAGYSATGHNIEQKFLLLHSPGQSGKSTLVEILYRLFGDYATTLPAEALVQRSADRIPSDIARLVGRRYVTVSEFDDAATLNERLIKQLTGGDTVTARFMYKDFFEFRPQGTIWVSSNHRPVVRGVDDGVWRRHLLVPFPVQIDAAVRDDYLGGRIRANELAGVLRWAVEGARKWFQQGLNPPSAVLAATATYREDSDLLGGFLDEVCEVGPAETVSKTDLYSSYDEWCRSGGLRPATKIAFGRMLKERPGLALTEDRIGKANVHVWVGIGLRVVSRVLRLVPDGDSDGDADGKASRKATRNASASRADR